MDRVGKNDGWIGRERKSPERQREEVTPTRGGKKQGKCHSFCVFFLGVLYFKKCTLFVPCCKLEVFFSLRVPLLPPPCCYI